jgi:uncharacterized membrane protein
MKKSFIFILLAACGGSENCPTYADVQPIMTQSCLGCHSADVNGANRQGATRGINYDTYEETKKEIDDIIARVTSTGSARMPPASSDAAKVSSAQAQTLAQWKACGTPQ